MDDNYHFRQELEKAKRWRAEVDARKAEEEQARTRAEVEQRQAEEAERWAIPHMIGNSIIFIIMIMCAVYLLVGAFLNARRELKGKPKKKRTSMVIFVVAIMIICYAVWYVLNPMP